MSLVVKTGVAAAVSLLTVGTSLGMADGGSGLAHAAVVCPRGEQAYTIVRGDTLSGIAARFRTSWQRLAEYNHIANPDRVYVGQRICISHQMKGVEGNKGPRHKPVQHPAPSKHASPKKRAAVGHGNPFAYPLCTWWADERYYQLHGVFVPWSNHANAWQWIARAQDFGWNVSTSPRVGAIMVLQPGVQGASPMAGHVAIVERILRGGRVIASSTNWGVHPGAVTNWEFVPGPGVDFISQ